MEMDANEQTARSNYHHHHQQQQQQQQQPPAWYGGTQHYHPPPSLQPMQWHMRHDQGSYSQQPPPPAMYHQPDFYSQPQHYPPTAHQHLQTPQHGQFYAQQNQGWPSSNGWSNQFTYHGPAVGLSQEEDWAAKARAWAAQAQFQPHATPLMEQPYPEALPRADPPHTALQPPGQEVPSTYNHTEVNSGYIQEASSYAPSTNPNFMQDLTSKNAEEDVLSVSFIQNLPSTSVQLLSHPQAVVSSSFQQDVASSYGQEISAAVSQGSGNQEQYNQRQQSPQEALIPQLGQNYQQSPHPPVLAASDHQQQPHSAYSEPPPHYEFNAHQHFEFQQHKLQEFQPPPSQFMPPMHSMGMDASESGYGGPASSVQVWPPIVAPGMPFTPMGPGLNGCPLTPQFEQHKHSHLQASHQLHGPQSMHMFGRPLGPPHGPGFQPGGPPLGAPFGYGGSPSLGPGPGAGIQPVFIAEGNGHLGVPDRPKKAAVPSWLREELLKKRAAAAMGGLTSLTDADDLMQANGDEASITPVRKASRRTDSSGISDSEEDEGEDEVEAARSTAINQEIKRVLTEVLLKVTDNLFDEIAQEVLDENDEDDDDVELQPQADLATQGTQLVLVEPPDNGSLVRSETSPSPPAAPAPVAPTRVLVAPVKKAEPSGKDDSGSLTSGSPAGNVLGLANYASDDEDAVQSGRETLGLKLEKHVEDAKDRRLSKEKADEGPERKQLKVAEAHYSIKESEKKAGKDKEEESEKRHKFEKEKGRELDKEREDRKEDRREREKERGREREKKEKKERPEQERKEQKRVEEVTNLCDQDGMSQLKLQPAEAEKLAGIGQHKASALDKASKEGKIDLSETGTVNNKRRVEEVTPKSDPSKPDDTRKEEVEKLDKMKEREKGGGKHRDKENDIFHDKNKLKETYGVSDKGEGKDTDKVREKKIQEADKRNTQRIRTDRSREKRKEDRDANRSRGRSTSPTNFRGRSTSSRSHSSSLSPNKDDSPRRRKLQVSRSNKRQSTSRSPARSKRRSTSRSPARSKRRSRSRSPVRSKRRINSRSPLRSKRRSTSRSPVRSKRRSNSRSPVRSKRRSTSRSPVRSRRRSSRSRSRSPRSKHFHRRVSPSLSRERDRRRRSRSGSPVRRRRRS